MMETLAPERWARGLAMGPLREGSAHVAKCWAWERERRRRPSLASAGQAYLYLAVCLDISPGRVMDPLCTVLKKAHTTTDVPEKARNTTS